MSIRLQRYLESNGTLNILVDELIPGVETYFNTTSLSPHRLSITRRSGREITADDVRNAHILLVRSVTQVNDALLLHADALFFVGSATIGVDHIDQPLLESLGIDFAHAPGCNAQGVAEYVMSAISVCQPDVFERENARVGLIGCGHTGSAVHRVLSSLGVSVVVYDPFKQRGHKLSLEQSNLSIQFVSFEEALASDVVSFHVPLTTAGEHPTYHVLNAQSVKYLKSSAVLINASRGDVFDQTSIRDHVTNELMPHGGKLVLDVWHNEPCIEVSMLAVCALATPHIAGHSWEGKWRGTLRLYQVVCECMGLEQTLSAESFPNREQRIAVSSDAPWHQLFKAAYPIERDDVAFRTALLTTDGSLDAIGAAFDALRKEYPQRCEWQHVVLQPADESEESDTLLDCLKRRGHWIRSERDVNHV
ncbi:MAG: 4-phosphoerythronate dehydrogenase [Pseudomonadota bacterium]